MDQPRAAHPAQAPRENLVANAKTPDGGDRAGPRPPGKTWVVFSVGLGSLMAAIDSSVANTVLPVIARDFRASITNIEWVLMIYLLVTSSLLLTWGRLGDLIGHRRVFLTGFAIFVVASAACGAAPNELALIGFRAVQASGAAMLSACGLVIITDTFGPRERGRGIGLIIAVTYFGLAVGPAIGGLLAGALSWRAVFYVNIPIGLSGILLGLRVLPHPAARQQRTKLDLAGAAQSALALASFLTALSQGQNWGWLSPRTLAAFAVAIASGVLFVRYESRHPAPMLELALFRNRSFSFAIASAVLFYSSVFFAALLFPFYLEQGRGYPVNLAGVLLMVTPAVMMVLAPPAGRLSDRIGPRLLSTAGLALTAIGLLGLAWLGPASGLATIILVAAFVGVGNGIFSSPNTSAIMGAAGRDRQGTASGMLSVARNAGMVVGIALAGAVFSARLSALGGPPAFFPAYRDTLLLGTVIAVAGTILSLTRTGSQPPRPAPG